MLFSIVCLLIAISPAFAMNNDTIVAVENTSQLQSSYYFDSNIESDTGDGSLYNPYKELDSNKISDNSIVYLASGDYVLKGSKTYANLSIVGENPEKTVINYEDAVGFTSKGSITLKNLTLVSLRININQNANLTAVNTIFKDNSAQNSVIYSNSNLGGNVVVLDNCSFFDNSAKYGGAIKLTENSILNITNSIFVNNHATYYGGAVACDNVTVYMSNCKFINDYSVNDAGGAIYLKDSDLIADNLEMTNCSAMMGGAITSLYSLLSLNNTLASNNKAKYYGGAIYKMYSYFKLFESLFENNSALNGGALFVDNVFDFRINNNNFTHNNALSTGGAVYSVLSESYYDIVDKNLNNTFKNNEANFENDVYQSYSANMAIGNNDYLLLHYNDSLYNGSLPTRYDLRDLGYVTPVKNQGNGGNCWAFSSLAALESAILKATNVSYDFSENNMKNLAAEYSDYGWAMETNEGGYDKMAMGYLTGWLGPVNESDDVYRYDSLLSPLLNSFIHVQNILFLTRNDYTDNDAIKRAIMDYGAVSTSLSWYSEFLYGKNYYCNNKDKSTNHAVAIVGWDDNYSASNFKKTPQGNGAWIIKNSWGNTGEKGYFYVSYYDVKFAEIGRYVTYAFVLNDTIRYDKNYQYDIPGRTDYFFNESSTVWYKIRYNSSNNEYLAAVSTYFEKDTNWDLSIYVNDVLKLKQSGFANPSYKTIDLDSLIPLNVGDIFEIVFKINVDKDAGVPISERISLNCELYYENLSFISYDGKNWVDFYDLEWSYPDHIYDSQVACIKAFTVLNPINSLINLTATNIHDNAADIIANVFDEYGNAIKYGNVTFNFSGIEKTIAVSNGVAKLSNVNIKHGINKIMARFNAEGYSSSSNFILISNSPVNTSVSLDIPSKHNPFEFKATVIDENNNPVESGWVVFNVDGVDYTVGVCDGVAVLNYSFETFGLKCVNVTYNDLYCYNYSTAQKSFYIYNINTSLALSFDNEFNPITITANVVDVNGTNVNRGAVTFYVDDASYVVDVNDGIANLTHVFESSGLNQVRAVYADKSFVYESSTCEKSIVVSLKSTTLSLNLDSNAKVHNPVNITATVVDEDNNPVKTGKIVFSLCGENIVSQVVNGKASINYIFKNEGLNDVFVQYIDVNYYMKSSKFISLNVSSINVDLDVGWASSARDVNITFSFSKPIDEYINVLINDTLHLIKSKDGKATISLFNLSNGKYKLTAYVDSYTYSCNNKTVEFSINPLRTSIIANNEIYYLNNNMFYSIVLKDEANLPISGYEVNLIIANKTITEITDSSGNALFKLDLMEGEYKSSIEFKGDEYYLKSSAIKTITVKSSIILPSITKYALNAKYSFKLFDTNGNGLKNKAVIFLINNVRYVLATDSNGIVNYNINLNPGSYNVIVTNPVTGEVKSQTINVVARITENKDLTMYYGAGSYYKVRVYGDNGNIAKNVEVTFTINGKTYSRYSDSNGYASIKISLAPKTYSITAIYKGFKVSNKVVVKPTLILKDMAVKRSKTFKYTVKLLNNKGKILKYKKVTVKFRGKTYKVNTNSKGIATFKIKAFSKIGKFTLTAIYGSAKISKKITVKK